jgi:hypothetical protein
VANQGIRFLRELPQRGGDAVLIHTDLPGEVAVEYLEKRITQWGTY